jgi:ATP-binding cassette subfamily C protein CydC
VLLGRTAPVQGIVVGLCFLTAALVLPFVAARATLAAGTRLSLAQAALRNAALDTLTGLREVRAFAAEGRMLAAVQAREAGLISAQHDIMRRGAWAAAGAFLCAQAALLAVLAGAGTGPAAAGGLLLVVAAFEVAAGLPRAGVLAGHAAAAAARVVEAAEGPPPVPDPVKPAALPAGSALRFEGVVFRYGPAHELVLDGLTLDVPEGARVAILGPSGAGKSTLAALALKIAAPEAGRVLLGGVDIAQLAATDVRSRVAYLSQTTHLFDDTIRANLLLARPEADDDALWAVLEAARIAEAVRELPHGLDTLVGEAGGRFSGGQGRRLALARALLSPAPVLILDEPCAGLDADTERDFFVTLNATPPGRTLVLIAHRLTGVERLDRIFRLSGGRAVAAAG